MQKNKTQSVAPSHIYMTFSEASTLSFLHFFNENSKSTSEVLKTWSTPVLDASDAMFCKRLVNGGLLRAGDDGKIILSYIDMLYVEILKTAIHYGANAKIIAGIKQLFDCRYNESFTTVCSPLAELLYNIHNGLDVVLAYTYDADYLTAYDCNFAPFFLGHPHEPMMQFSLIPLLNKVRSWFKHLEPIEVKHSMYDAIDISRPESRVINMLHNLKETETLHIKPLIGKNGKYHTSIERDVEAEMLKKFDAFCKENNFADYADIVVKRRKGGIANVKMSENDVI